MHTLNKYYKVEFSIEMCEVCPRFARIANLVDAIAAFLPLSRNILFENGREV